MRTTVDVGYSWDSPEGKRVVVEHGPGDRLLIKTEGHKFAVLLTPEQILQDERRDTANLAFQKRQQEKALLEHQAALLADDVDGFDAGMAPMARRRVIDALNKLICHGGKAIRRKDLIKGWLAQGAEVRQTKFGRVLQLPNGNFLTQADLTKTAIDYANYLASGDL